MKGNCWGPCPYRWFGWVETKGLQGGLGYICSKNNSACGPTYCLGPDEDTKGDADECEAV